MAQIINTNIASMNAQRNLSSSQSANATSLERLSSGLRINNAKDDAAGLAISTRFESQTRGLGQAVRNAGDGVSLAQTAGGALQSMTDNLQRMRELSVKSANGTNSDDDRMALQAEVSQLVEEIERTAEETNFNGRNLFDGGFEGIFQIGANAGQTVGVSIGELTTDRLGTSDQVGVSGIGTADSLANGDLNINGVAINNSTAQDDSFSTQLAGASGIAKAEAINRESDATGVRAFANATVANGTEMETGGGAADQDININGVDISLQSTVNVTDGDLAATRSSVIQSINAVSEQTGVVASDGGDSNGVILTAEDGRNIILSAADGEEDLSDFGLATAVDNGDLDDNDALRDAFDDSEGVFTAGVTLVAEGQTQSIDITGGFGIGSGDLENSGFTRGSFDARVAYATCEANVLDADADVDDVTAAALEDGDLVINGVSIGASTSTDDTASSGTADSSNVAASGIAIAAAINRSTDSTGVTAEVNATQVVGVTEDTDDIAATQGDDLDILINNVDVGTVVSQGDRDADISNTIDLINSKSGQTGVRAENNGEGITLLADDGRNISIAIEGTGDAVAVSGAAFGLDSGEVDGIGAGADFAADAATTYSTVTLSSSNTIEVSGGTNGTEGLQSIGFTRGDFGGGNDGQFLSEVDISTFEGAQAAITAVDNALSTVSAVRSDLGAIQNRFESTISNLEINRENLSAANSRIRDADFAAESAELSRTQVLQQAGVSIVAQANQRPQQALTLLG